MEPGPAPTPLERFGAKANPAPTPVERFVTETALTNRTLNTRIFDLKNIHIKYPLTPVLLGFDVNKQEPVREERSRDRVTYKFSPSVLFT